MNFHGNYKEEWKKRAKFFEKQTALSEKRVVKTKWAPSVFSPFRKKKIAEDSKLEKIWGSLDAATVQMEDKKQTYDEFKASVANFKKVLTTVKSVKDKLVRGVMATLEEKKAMTAMTPDEKKKHVLDVKNLTKLYESDFEALIATADSMMYNQIKDRKTIEDLKARTENNGGDIDLRALTGNLRDMKRRQAAMKANIAKGISWLNKLDRDPTVKAFNAGIGEVCRDMSAQIDQMLGLYGKNPGDKKVLTPASKLFRTLGAKRGIPDDSPFDKVLSFSSAIRKTLTSLAKWNSTLDAEV